MADTEQQILNKLFDLQSNCSHEVLIPTNTSGLAGQWLHEICERCGKQIRVQHNCAMGWNEAGTALTCPNCKADGT